MKVYVNDKAVETHADNLEALAGELGLPSKGIAVAVDNKMIPRTQWNGYLLAEGVQIVIIKAVCGG